MKITKVFGGQIFAFDSFRKMVTIFQMSIMSIKHKHSIKQTKNIFLKASKYLEFILKSPGKNLERIRESPSRHPEIIRKQSGNHQRSILESPRKVPWKSPESPRKVPWKSPESPRNSMPPRLNKKTQTDPYEVFAWMIVGGDEASWSKAWCSAAAWRTQQNAFVHHEWIKLHLFHTSCCWKLIYIFWRRLYDRHGAHSTAKSTF